MEVINSRYYYKNFIIIEIFNIIIMMIKNREESIFLYYSFLNFVYFQLKKKKEICNGEINKIK